MSNIDDILQLFHQLDKQAQIEMLEALKRLYHDPQFDAIGWLNEAKENRGKDANHDNIGSSRKLNE